jgi:hypothetical protein
VSLEISKIRRAKNSPQGPCAGKQQGVIYVDYFDSFAGGSVVRRRRLRLQPLALSRPPVGQNKEGAATSLPSHAEIAEPSPLNIAFDRRREGAEGVNQSILRGAAAAIGALHYAWSGFSSFRSSLATALSISTGNGR